MKRNTGKDHQSGNDSSNVPISEHPSMIELKKLVTKLSPDRRRALDEYLVERGGNHGREGNQEAKDTDRIIGNGIAQEDTEYD
jgi:hypothetical protein